jgi:nitric oxide reductase subunit B
VVHLWVEGFFEVFATVILAFLFTRLGLLPTMTATRAVLFSTIIYLSGGIIGTFHHLYFTGTPTAVLALGATFSALEVVPLVLIGYEAYGNLTLSRLQPWVTAYKWPIFFFVAVGFWNLVGAGLFGFFINPPIALYYMQGLHTTPVHGHTALFGVYGMLGIGLMLFCLRGLTVRQLWKTEALGFAFWAMNIGLALMVLISLLPIGLPNLGQRRPRTVVRPFSRVPPNRRDANTPMATHRGGYRLCGRDPCSWVVYSRAQNRVVSSD